MEMRHQWACPELSQAARDVGLFLPVDGSLEEFPDCPAAYLRTASDVVMLADRWGKTPFAEHLIDGAIHPASIISTYAAEMESGARSVETISPRALALVHLWNAETQGKRDFERQHRKENQ